MATQDPLSEFRTPRHSASATTAHANSVRRTLRIARNSAGLIRPTEYTMTTAASVACGMRVMIGASSNIVTSAATEVTSPASWERAPASRFTAVCEVPPPAGMEPNSAPPALAKPVATSFAVPAFNACSPVAANARPACNCFREAHQGNASRRRPELFDQGEIRQGKRRQSGGHLADRMHSVCL